MQSFSKVTVAAYLVGAIIVTGVAMDTAPNFSREETDGARSAAERACIGSTTVTVDRTFPVREGYAEICARGGSSTTTVHYPPLSKVTVVFSDYGPYDELLINGSDVLAFEFAAIFGGSESFTVTHGDNIDDYPAGYTIKVKAEPLFPYLEDMWSLLDSYLEEYLKEMEKLWWAIQDWWDGLWESP